MNLTIHALKKEDFEGLFKYCSDKEATQYLTWNAYSSKNEYEKFFIDASKKTGYPDEFLGIYFEDRIIGSIHLILRANNQVQFGFGITKENWNKGICTKIVKLAINHLKKTWDMENFEVIADVHINNFAARKVLEKNNFFFLSEKTNNENRLRYTYLVEKSSKDIITSKIITLLKNDQRIESVFLSGSAAIGNDNKHSDIDIIVVVNEESNFISVISESESILNSAGQIISIYHATPYHHFIIYKGPIIVDISFTTLSFVWAIKNSKIVFDKSNFLAKEKNNFHYDHLVKDMLVRGITNISRILSKIEKKEYWIVPRFINSLRDSSILPLLAVIYGYDIQNITKLELENIAPELKEKLLETFIKPTKEDSITGLISCFYLLKKMKKDCKIKFEEIDNEFNLISNEIKRISDEG